MSNNPVFTEVIDVSLDLKNFNVQLAQMIAAYQRAMFSMAGKGLSPEVFNTTNALAGLNSTVSKFAEDMVSMGEGFRSVFTKATEAVENIGSATGRVEAKDRIRVKTQLEDNARLLRETNGSADAYNKLAGSIELAGKKKFSFSKLTDTAQNEVYGAIRQDPALLRKLTVDQQNQFEDYERRRVAAHTSAEREIARVSQNTDLALEQRQNAVRRSIEDKAQQSADKFQKRQIAGFERTYQAEEREAAKAGAKITTARQSADSRSQQNAASFQKNRMLEYDQVYQAEARKGQEIDKAEKKRKQEADKAANENQSVWDRFFKRLTTGFPEAAGHAIKYFAIFRVMGLVLQGVEQAFMAVFATIKSGWDYITNLQESATEIQGVLASTVTFSENIKENFNLAGKAAAEAVREMQEIAIKGNITMTQMMGGFKSFMEAGGQNLTRSVGESLKVAEMMAVAMKAARTGGQSARAMISEIPRLLDGTIDKSSKLLMVLNIKTPEEWLKILEEAKQQHNLVDILEKRLKPFLAVLDGARERYKDMSELLKLQMDRMIGSIVSPVWDWWLGVMQRASEWLSKHGAQIGAIVTSIGSVVISTLSWVGALLSVSGATSVIVGSLSLAGLIVARMAQGFSKIAAVIEYLRDIADNRTDAEAESSSSTAFGAKRDMSWVNKPKPKSSRSLNAADERAADKLAKSIFDANHRWDVIIGNAVPDEAESGETLKMLVKAAKDIREGNTESSISKLKTEYDQKLSIIREKEETIRARAKEREVARDLSEKKSSDQRLGSLRSEYSQIMALSSEYTGKIKAAGAKPEERIKVLAAIDTEVARIKEQTQRGVYTEMSELSREEIAAKKAENEQIVKLADVRRNAELNALKEQEQAGLATKSQVFAKEQEIENERHADRMVSYNLDLVAAKENAQAKKDAQNKIDAEQYADRRRRSEAFTAAAAIVSKEQADLDKQRSDNAKNLSEATYSAQVTAIRRAEQAGVILKSEAFKKIRALEEQRYTDTMRALDQEILAITLRGGANTLALEKLYGERAVVKAKHQEKTAEDDAAGDALDQAEYTKQRDHLTEMNRLHYDALVADTEWDNQHGASTRRVLANNTMIAKSYRDLVQEELHLANVALGGAMSTHNRAQIADLEKRVATIRQALDKANLELGTAEGNEKGANGFWSTVTGFPANSKTDQTAFEVAFDGFDNTVKSLNAGFQLFKTGATEIINGFKQGGIAGGIGAGASFASSLLKNVPGPLGDILGLAGGVMTLIGGLFMRAAKVIAESIRKEMSQTMQDYNRGNTDLLDTIHKMEALRTDAINRLSGRKGGKDELDKILTEIDGQMYDLDTQQKSIADSFGNSLEQLRLHSDTLGNFLKSWQDINKQAREYYGATHDAAKAQEFLQLSLAKLREQAASDFAAGEGEGIQDAIQLNQLLQDRINLEIAFKKAEFDTLAKDAIERRQSNAVTSGLELAKQRADYNKQRADLDAQITQTTAKLDLERQVYNIASDTAALKARASELELEALAKQIDKYKELKQIVEGIYTPNLAGVGGTFNSGTFKVDITINGTTTAGVGGNGSVDPGDPDDLANLIDEQVRDGLQTFYKGNY